MFNSFEVSRSRGRPVTLYLFLASGSFEDSPSSARYYAYTDAEQPVTHDGITYEPVPIDRDAVAASGSLDRSQITVRMPRTIALRQDYIVWPPTDVMTLTVRQGHLGDPDQEFLVIWAGRALSVGREGEECVVSGEPISSALRRPGLRRNYQIGCPHVLYGGRCRASEAAATVAGTVASLTGTTVTMTAGWQGAFDSSKFLDGMVKWPNADGGIEIRRILKVTGDALLLSGLLRDLTAGAMVSVVLGCNHQLTDCEALHANIQNYGGCAWIPLKNPIGYVNQFY